MKSRLYNLLKDPGEKPMLSLIILRWIYVSIIIEFQSVIDTGIY